MSKTARERQPTDRPREAGTDGHPAQPISSQVLLEQLPAIIYIVELGEDAKTVYISPQVESLLGFSQAEWLADPELWLRQIHPDDREEVLAQVRQGDERGQPLDLEYRALTRDGRVLWFRNRTTLLRDEAPAEAGAGQARYSQGILFDVTERKKAEQALRESQQFLQNVFDALRDGISVLDTDLNVIRTNRWMEQRYARQMPLTGRKCYEVYQQRRSPCSWCPTLRTIESGEPHAEIVPCPSADEPAGWLELSTFAIKDGKGHVSSVIEYVKDVTERVNAERATQERQRYLEGVLSAAPDAIVTLDPHNRIVEWNSGAERLFGYRRDEVVGQDIDPLIAQGSHRKEAVGFTRMVSGGETLLPTETVRYHRDGSPLNVILAAAPVVVDDELVGLVAVYSDITERKQVEERIRQEREMLSLVNVLNHAANRGDSLDKIVRLFARGTKGVFSINEAAVYLLSEDKETLVLQNLALPGNLLRRIEKAIGSKIPKVEIRPTPDSLYGQMLQAGAPCLTDDPAKIRQMMAECTNSKTLRKLVPAISRILGYRSVMSVPLIIDGETIGLTDMSRPEPFSEIDLERFALLAEQFTANLRRRRAEEALRRSLEETAHSQRLLLALSQGAQALQRARTPTAVYHAIGEQVTKLGFDATILCLSDEAPGEAGGAHLILPYFTLKPDLVQAAEKLTGLSITGYRFRLTPGGFFQQILAAGVPVYSHLEAAPFVDALPPAVRPLAGAIIELIGWRQSIFAPLIVGGETWGLLVVTGSDLDEVDVPAITAFANQAAVAIENARLYRETQRLAAFNEGIILSMAEGIAVEQSDGSLTFVNPAGAEMLGYAPGELVGVHWTTIIPPDQQPILRAAVEQWARGESGHCELELMHRDGRRIPALVSGTRRSGTEGHLTGALAVFTDITDRKQAEDALQQRAAQLALLNEIGHRVTAFLDLDEVLIRAARLIQEGFGFHHVGLFTRASDPDRLVMRARAGEFALPLPPAHSVELGEGLVGWVGLHGETLLANDVDAEPRYLNPHPERLPTRSELSIPIRIGDEIVGVLDLQSPQPNSFDPSDVTTLETLADQLAVAISNARLYSQAAQRNRELTLLNRVIAATAAGEALISVLEAVCRELALAFELPQAAAALLNKEKTRAEIVAEYLALGQPSALGKSIPVTAGSAAQDLMAQKTPLVIQDAQADPRQASVHDLLRQRGSTSLLVLPLVVDGEVMGSLGLSAIEARDFSPEEVNLAWRVAEQVSSVLARVRLQEERRQLEEQFHQAQKMQAVGRLAGGVAHDLNNLLTVINLSTRFLERNLHTEDPLRQHVGRIHDAGQRAGDLTRQLLAFSRREIIEPQVLSLNRVLGELERMLRRLIGEDVMLKTRLAHDLWPVKVDPTQIEQVVINLAINARDAMPEGGKLTIETANVVLDAAYAAHHLDVAPGEYVLLAISDTGMGMSDKVKAHLFEPFFTTKERGKGTGLGLASVHGIIKQNRGHIGVYSEVGQGTSFKIYLPRAAGGVRTTRPVPPEGAALPRGSETLLVVEDEAHVRGLMREILAAQGYRILTAGDGMEALRVAREHPDPIHLLITDVVMPRMSGRALADELQPLRPEMRVLYTSGYTDNAIVHHGVLDEGVHFLPKPFELEALAQRVRSVLDSDEP
jgi:PAS domain S-box-containing protein